MISVDSGFGRAFLPGRCPAAYAKAGLIDTQLSGKARGAVCAHIQMWAWRDGRALAELRNTWDSPQEQEGAAGESAACQYRKHLILTAVFPRSALDGGHVWGLRSQQRSSASQTREKDHPRWEVAENHREMMEIGMTKFNC